MPNVNGFEVLEYFDKNNIFDRFPVSVISGANFPLEILKPYPIFYFQSFVSSFFDSYLK